MKTPRIYTLNKGLRWWLSLSEFGKPEVRDLPKILVAEVGLALLSPLMLHMCMQMRKSDGCTNICTDVDVCHPLWLTVH